MDSKTVRTRPFDDPASPPTEDGLRIALGPAFPAYLRLSSLTSRFRRDWSFAGRSGWMLKVHSGGKALLYVTPLEGAFRIGMAIRENERDALSRDPELGDLHETLLAARKYAEGYALQFEVRDAEIGDLEPFLARLMALRG